MPKENMKRFFEKAAATPALAEKLGMVQKQYVEQIATLARENGFELAPEDFAEEVQPLGDEAVENAIGGWNPRGPIFP